MSNRLSKVISDDSLNRIISIESAGNPDAKNANSSAAGLGQFISSTWDAVGAKHYPREKAEAGSNWRAMRVGKNTASLQLRMLARFCEDNARIMRSTRDGDLYMAHFLGAGGAQKAVAADQRRSAVDVCGEQAANANRSIFYHKNGSHVTCGELRAWAEDSMRRRWEQHGRKDWIGIWGGPALTQPVPDVEPAGPPPPKVAPEAKGAGGAVVVGGGAVVVAASRGVDWSIIVGMGVCAAVVVVAVFFIIRAARRSGG